MYCVEMEKKYFCLSCKSASKERAGVDQVSGCLQLDSQMLHIEILTKDYSHIFILFSEGSSAVSSLEILELGGIWKMVE